MQAVNDVTQDFTNLAAACAVHRRANFKISFNLHEVSLVNQLAEKRNPFVTLFKRFPPP